MKTLIIVFVSLCSFLSSYTGNDVFSAAAADDIACVKPLDDEPRPITGRTKKLNNSAVASATVDLYLVGGTTPIATRTSDSNGDFAFSAVNPGNYVLKANASGFQESQVNVTVAGAPVSQDIIMTEE